MPFAAVAVDLLSGEEVILSSGSVRDAVEASSSLPGYFYPFERDHQILVDGAVLQVVPTLAARQLGADFVIAVNVSQSLQENPQLENTLDIMFRATSILNHRYNHYLLREADVVLRPDVGERHWSDFDQYEECIYKGEEVTRKALPILQQRLKEKQKRQRSFWRRKPEREHVEIQNQFL